MFGRKIDDRTIVMDSTPQLPTFPDKPEPARMERKKIRTGT